MQQENCVCRCTPCIPASAALIYTLPMKFRCIYLAFDTTNKYVSTERKSDFIYTFKGDVGVDVNGAIARINLDDLEKNVKVCFISFFSAHFWIHSSKEFLLWTIP